MKTRLWTAALGVAVLSWSRASVAQELLAPTPCSGVVNRRNVAACAIAGSPPIREELAAQRAAEGRREAARPFLPSNPTLTGSVSSRVGPTERTTNWNVALGQELEVAGQSVLRGEVTERELRAQGHRVVATRREVAAQAWWAYFTVLAVQERLQLAGKLEQATSSVATTVRAMSTTGLASEVDADIAETAALRATTDRFSLESLLSAGRAQLSRLTGAVQELSVEGPLDPLKLPSAPGGLDQNPLLLSLAEQQQAARRKVDLLQRERIPNPTVSLFAQNDGFDERVLGIGLSIPVPLPQPVGRTGAGQVAEAKALAGRAGAEAERIHRDLQTELLIAKAEWEAASKARQLYTADRKQRVLTRLDNIAIQVKAGRLPVRDALLAQQALVEQLKAEVDAREALCMASVRFARAAGHSLEGDSL